MASVSLICGLGARKVVRVSLLVKFVDRLLQTRRNSEGKHNHCSYVIILHDYLSNLFSSFDLSSVLIDFKNFKLKGKEKPYVSGFKESFATLSCG